VVHLLRYWGQRRIFPKSHAKPLLATTSKGYAAVDIDIQEALPFYADTGINE
jgi:hypothetical protein